MKYRSPLYVICLSLLFGCREATPVDIDATNDACLQCRMIASEPRLAAQVVAPGTEPLIFDDIGCLRDYLAANPVAKDAIVYVADHRTGKWIRAEEAVYTSAAALSTPMGSRIVAHADLASKDADPAAHGGEPVHVRSILSLATAGGVPR